MKLLSKQIDKSSLNQFYNSYILPILDYRCMIWGHCSVTATDYLNSKHELRGLYCARNLFIYLFRSLITYTISYKDR